MNNDLSIFPTFNPADWNYHGYWKASIFPQYFWFSSFNEQKIKTLGLSLTESGYLVFGNGFYLTKKAVYKEVETVLTATLEADDLTLIRNLRQEAINASKKAAEFATQVTSPLTAEVWQEIINQGKNVTLFWSLAAGYFAPISDALLLKAMEKERIDSNLLPTLISQQETLLTDMYRSLLSLKKQFTLLNLPITKESLQNNAALAGEVEAHRKQYEWIQIVSWIGPTLTTAEVLNMMQKTHDEKAPQIDRTQYSPYLQNALEIMESSWFIRQISVEYFSKFSFTLIPLLKEYAENNGFEYRDLLQLTPPEVLQHLQHKTTFGELIAQRKDGNWLAFMEGGDEIVLNSTEDVAQLKKLMLPQAENSQNVFKGQIGNRGIAQGKVKIILNSDDFGKLEPGDVLVSTMTTPDFVVLMQQAAAFITDNGGMLCHAAIIARELNKPCIIGTKIATQILKDGDLVEVNANERIVRKLEA